MSTTNDLRTGIRVLDVAAFALDRVTAFASVLGTVTTLSLMVLITVDVVGRFAFGRPIAGVPEIVAMSILAIVFLQVANTLAQGKLTRSDAVLQLLGRRRPRLKQFIDAIMHALGALLIGILISAFYPLFMRSYGRNEMVGTVGQFIAPIWPVYFIVLMGSVLLFLVFLQRTISLLVLSLSGSPEGDRR